jgi:2-polyprenyl-3-methyl-5-hydroxy-6-metoxy-1,4-benzoquinol methylase
MLRFTADLSPATRSFVEDILAAYPDHEGYLVKSFRDRSRSTSRLAEQTAGLIGRLHAGDHRRLVEGYLWICRMVMEEELHFRREGSYRNSSFAEVNASVYQNKADMVLYMDGLLATEVLWSQHARCMDFYVNTFVPKLPTGFRHLEIGPGHGLLLYYTAIAAACGSLEAWDISPASLELTAECLARLGAPKAVELRAGNVFEEAVDRAAEFDSVTLSEVVEHLEDPLRALRNIHGLLAADGLLYVNVPVNAPAVDHIFQLKSPSEAVALVEAAGFTVDETLCAPVAGYSLTRALKADASISVAIVARRGPGRP